MFYKVLYFNDSDKACIFPVRHSALVGYSLKLFFSYNSSLGYLNCLGNGKEFQWHKSLAEYIEQF